MKVALIPAGMPEMHRRWIDDAYGPIVHWYEQENVSADFGYIVDEENRRFRTLRTGEETRVYRQP